MEMVQYNAFEFVFSPATLLSTCILGRTKRVHSPLLVVKLPTTDMVLPPCRLNAT